MKRNLTPIASGVALLLMGAAMSAQAQEADSNIQTVVTTGIRASLQQSLNVKRRATTNIEVVTAEDVGKMPDKNVADTLQRLPGVSISQSAAGSGGFDENDRVSLRGTSPSLTNTTVNGHSVSSGDWFILDQVGGAVGRSISFSLLPSEIVGQVVVNKTPTADQIEGGVAGSVDIRTRHPLDAKQQLSIDGAIQAVYATLPGTTDPQYSGSVNWKNESGTFGFMGQYFNEKRHLRRDGQEMLVYEQVQADNAAVLGAAGVAAANAADPGPGWNKPYGTPATGTNVINPAAHPDLVGVWAPRLIGSTLFTQVRHRKGGILDFQIRPTKDLTLEATYFKSSMDASNYNRNYMMDLGAGGGDTGIFAHNWNSTVGHNSNAPDAGYTITNGTLTHATWSNLPAGSRVGIVDDISRPGSASSTQFVDFDGKFRVSDNFTLSGKIGQSKGTGDTPVQNVYEGDVRVNQGGGVSYTLNGTSGPANVAFYGLTTGDTNTFTGTTLDWIFGAVDTWTKDKDKYGQIDGEFNLGSGLFTDIKFGYRHTTHSRYNNIVNQRPFRGGKFTDANGNVYQTNATPTGGTSINPAWEGTTYPADWGSDLGGGNSFPHQPWQLTEDQLAKFTSTYAWRDPVYRTDYELMYSQNEKTDAYYVNTDFGGQGWSGNAGVRFVKTKDHVDNYTIVPGSDPATGHVFTPAEVAAKGWFINGGGQGSNFIYPGSYVAPNSDDNDTNVALPSANLKFELNKDMLLRAGISRTMTRPDYGALAGVTSTDDQTMLGNAGNSQLKPIKSTNFDLAFQWFYAPRALLSAGWFYMDMKDYVSFANVTQSRYNQQISDRTGIPTFSNYLITMPVNTDAKVHGFEFNAQVPLGGGFGLDGNLTLADGKLNDCTPWTSTTTSSPCDLLGTSKTTKNIGAFFENDVFNARVGWAWRSAYLAAYDRNAPLYQAATGSLAVSANYFINKNLSVTFSGENVNKPILKNYVYNEDQPRSFYSNGAQYYAGLRFKF